MKSKKSAKEEAKLPKERIKEEVAKKTISQTTTKKGEASKTLKIIPHIPEEEKKKKAETKEIEKITPIRTDIRKTKERIPSIAKPEEKTVPKAEMHGQAGPEKAAQKSIWESELDRDNTALNSVLRIISHVPALRSAFVASKHTAEHDENKILTGISVTLA